MTTTTLRSAINRADSQAHDAQQEVEKAVAEIECALDRLTEATINLRASHARLQQLQRLVDEHGIDHEIPYDSER